MPRLNHPSFPQDLTRSYATHGTRRTTARGLECAAGRFLTSTLGARWRIPSVCCLALGLIGAAPNTIQAQQPSTSGQAAPPPQTVVVIGEPARHATSGVECRLRGQADVIRSVGLQNLWNSQAQCYTEQARAQATQNETYLRERRESLAAKQKELKKKELDEQGKRRVKRQGERAAQDLAKAK